MMLRENKFDVSGNFCFLANLCSYLDYYNLSINESKLGMMIGYFGFYFTTKKLASKEIILGRNATFEEMFQTFQLVLERPLKTKIFSCFSEATEFINRKLKEGIIPMIWIDDFYLNYSPYFKLSHYESLIILLEISEDSILIYDNQLRRVEKQSFEEAVLMNDSITIVYTEEEKLSWAENENSILVNGIDRILKKFYFEESFDDQYLGFYGMEKFLENLEKNKDRNEIYNYFYQMNRASGPAVTREKMYFFLKDLELSCPNIDVKLCEDLYNKLSVAWRKIGNLLFKLSTNLDNNLKGRILARIVETIESEKLALKELEKVQLQLKMICNV